MRVLTLLLALLVTPAGKGVSTDLKPYKGDPRPPPLALPALSGEIVRLEDYRGKVVLVNFWASWCTPCLAEMPSLQRLQKRLGGPSFAVVTVNIGEDRDAVKTWLEKLDVRLAVLLDRDGRTARAWRVFAFPSTFIIDREGDVTHANFGALEWDEGPAFELIRSLVRE